MIRASRNRFRRVRSEGTRNTFEIRDVGSIGPFILFQNKTEGRVGARDRDSEVLGVFGECTERDVEVRSRYVNIVT
jgi:hypothetical protein